MRSSTISIIILTSILLFSCFTSVHAQVANTDTEKAAKSDKTDDKTIKASKKTTNSRVIDTQLSGYSAQFAEQVFVRLSVDQNKNNVDWSLRGAFGRTGNEVTNVKNNTTSKNYVTTTRLDTRMEKKRGKSYDVFNGVLNIRDKEKPKDETGYYLCAYGFGKQLNARNRGDIGLGILRQYDNGEGIKPVAVCSITGNRPLFSKFSLDCRIFAIQPVDKLKNTKVDSDIGLNYAMTDGCALRLGWTANNLIRPDKSKGDWDSVIRLAISFKNITPL